MACEGDQITIRPGRNVWLLGRTDRDAPTYADVVQTAAAFLSRVFGERSPEEVISTALGRYIIGAARPVLIEALQTPPGKSPLDVRPALEGSRIARREDCETLRTVKADRLWWVVARFDWRGPRTARDWPARAVNWLGIPSRPDHDLDWLLIEANHAGPAKEPDTSWGEETGERLEKVAERAGRKLRLALVPVGLALLGAGAVYLAVIRGKQ